LRGRNHASVADRIIVGFVDDLLAFRDDAKDRIAGFAARLLADCFKYLLEPLDLALGFALCVAKASRNFSVALFLASFANALTSSFSAK
jgi:hypothetical protein